MTHQHEDRPPRVLVIVAHPDDADFWAGGTVATWTSAGVDVTYLVLTDGDSGGFDPSVDRKELSLMRRTEQRRAAHILGVSEVRFSGRCEGELSANDVTLRREVVRVIRTVRPNRVVTWSPEWNWSRFRTSCHIDHRSTGELALASVYPDAENSSAHKELFNLEKLAPWTVNDIWMLNSPKPNCYVDVTEMFDRKIEALRAHESQIAGRDKLADEMRERIALNTVAAGLASDRLAEAFQVIRND
ncbi:MAG: PIG-L deacetylase family protein [Pseudonocardia sp.]